MLFGLWHRVIQSILIACQADSNHRSENQSSNPLYPSGSEQVQRGQIVTVEGSSVSGAEVVIRAGGSSSTRSV